MHAGANAQGCVGRPSLLTMAMTVMQVRVMRMTMNARRMQMPMGVRTARRDAFRMVVPMVLVMLVAVFMGDRLVSVQMQMPLREV